MTKIQNRQSGYKTIDKSTECFGHWAFEFRYCLEFEYCDLGFQANDGGSQLLQSYLLFTVTFPRGVEDAA